MLRFSIIICTHNRSNLLPDALETLRQQIPIKDDYEILLIDNASTDNTREIIYQIMPSLPKLRYLYEKEVGLSFARNRGWRESRGFYTGFLDDDAKVPPNWLMTAEDISRQIDPDVFGGPYFPFYTSPKKSWFTDDYGSWKQGDEARYIKGKEYLVGGNLFIKRSILESFGGFNTDFGMKGNRIGYGEETELLEKIKQKKDNCLFYVPGLFIYHLVRPEKMTWKWIIRKKFADGRDYYNLFPERKKPVGILSLLYKTLRFSILLVLDLVIRVFLRDRRKYPKYQNYYYEHTMKYIAAFGEISEQIKGTRHNARK